MPHGLGHRSRGTFASGLEGLQLWPSVFRLPPPLLRRPVPCAFWARHYYGPPAFCWPAVHTGAGAPSWCQSTAPSLPSGLPLWALLPFTWPCGPHLCWESSPGQSCKSHAHWVQSVQWASGSHGVHPIHIFMFCIYRGFATPLWGVD